MTNRTSIPSEEIDKAIVFKRPFTLNIAAKNEPNKSKSNNHKSNDSGKGFNTSGIKKTKMINVIININEIKLRYFFM